VFKIWEKKFEVLKLTLFELYFNDKKELSIGYTKLFQILKNLNFSEKSFMAGMEGFRLPYG
jgi:hypothetical protein